MSTTIYQVDAFTSEPFTGNPAAVCLLAASANEEWMQQVARELNLSETAFLHPDADGYHLRWFTPLAEVDLCGHATLASAHVLWETGELQADHEARFHTASGLLSARKEGDRIWMDFPALAYEELTPPPELSTVLGIVPVFAGANQFAFLIVVDSADDVRKLQPDFSRLRTVDSRGVIVTAPSDQSEYDFISRAFLPAIGIGEDPVTGSAHCCLGPYWSEQLGKTELVGYQASARGGVVQVIVKGDRVLLGGQAVTLIKMELF